VSGVEIVFSVTEMDISEIPLEGEIMQKISIPGVFLPNDAGAPDLPGTGRWIAVPQGATVDLEVVGYRKEVLHDMNIIPAFEIPFENDDSQLKYNKNPEIYERDAYYPAAPVVMSDISKMRGVDVVIVGVTPFQYNPVTKDLIIYKDIRVRVNFQGGNGYFGEDRLRSRWWEPVLRQNLLNYESLPQVEFHPLPPATDEDNVEYIIIIPDDPNFAAWADTLKRWRNEQGIRTGVVTLSEIGGNTWTLIDNYINNAYNTWSIPPVAVLLLSDYQSSGDQYGITANTYNYGFYTCRSDNYYADVDGDQLPDVNIARICAQDNTDLETMINKMLDYERTPSTDPNFYLHPLIAGGWQTERWFILACEIVYGYLDVVLGKDPVRQYAIYSGTPGSVWSTNSNTWMVVNYFGPSGLGYIPSSPSYLTNWSGNASGINSAINSGAFLVQHRDHGSEDGWGEPSYHNWDLNNLNNTMYPYVFSTNCSTGKFDWYSECFAEKFHRIEAGALGIHAATNVSYSFVNDTYIWGIYDGMWPDFDPGYGMDPYGEENLRPGFASASGKYYLQASSWPYNPQNKDETYYLFHHFGDAFITLYSEVPQNLTVSHASTVQSTATSFTVTADAGSLIGISQNGAVLGAAEGTGSAVSIPITSPIGGIPMRVTVTKANYYRYISDVTVEGTGPSMTLTLTYQSGSPVPSGGGNLYFDVYLENTSGQTLNFDAWLEVSYEGGAPWTVVQRSFTDYQPGWSINRPNMFFPVPAYYAGGNYEMIAKAGIHPDIAWAEDSFPFVKSGDDSWGEGPLVPAGVPNPFDKIDKGEGESIPAEFELLGAYPNPFNPTTTLKFNLNTAERIQLAVFDVSGREVARLVDGWRNAGAHEVTFDASTLASGVYLVRLISGNQTAMQKMVLMK
jgi:hypothetical protein